MFYTVVYSLIALPGIGGILSGLNVINGKYYSYRYIKNRESQRAYRYGTSAMTAGVFILLQSIILLVSGLNGLQSGSTDIVSHLIITLVLWGIVQWTGFLVSEIVNHNV